MKRQRGRGRKPGGGHHHGGFNPHQPNRTIESSGPDGKVRGSAAHIYERYLQLARDAASSGDRVLSENYLQHADHYFRLVRMMQPAMPPPQAERFASQVEFEGEDEGAMEGEGEDMEAAGADVAERSESGEPAQPHERGERQERGDGDFRRRRGRRNRFRPSGEGEAVEGSEERAPREDRGERQDRGDRRERSPRERNEAETPEGFSHGPRPAFLGGD